MFIDRDPRHFGLVLNFLRDGTCVLPADAGGRRELLQEADFYQVCECSLACASLSCARQGCMPAVRMRHNDTSWWCLKLGT